jgi:hypothetical protein
LAKILAITLSLDEFNAKALEGEIFEVSVVSGQIRILCPSPSGPSGRACGAHLKDFWIVPEKKEGRSQMRIGCQVCRAFTGLRLIGLSGYINGQFAQRNQ